MPPINMASHWNMARGSVGNITFGDNLRLSVLNLGAISLEKQVLFQLAFLPCLLKEWPINAVQALGIRFSPFSREVFSGLFRLPAGRCVLWR